MSSDYTLGNVIHVNTYHVPIIRSKLTRNIGALSSKIRDEILTAFDEVLDLKCNGEELMFDQFLSVAKSRAMQNGRACRP